MISNVVMSIAALLAGAGVSAGVFAFVLVIGVVPRVLAFSKIKNIIMAENIMICGVIAGNVSSVIELNISTSKYVAELIICIYGLCVGIFVGCIAVALAEILHTFPILYKRMKLRAGLGIIVVCMAIGKTVGSLYYFLFGYGM